MSNRKFLMSMYGYAMDSRTRVTNITLRALCNRLSMATEGRTPKVQNTTLKKI